ncbi:MAG TPA: hypothetical protein PK231_05700 [Acidocella sp.]|nr:hypothetical protein [Acidocella sp.]
MQDSEEESRARENVSAALGFDIRSVTDRDMARRDDLRRALDDLLRRQQYRDSRAKAMASKWIMLALTVLSGALTALVTGSAHYIHFFFGSKQ